MDWMWIFFSIGFGFTLGIGMGVCLTAFILALMGFMDND